MAEDLNYEKLGLKAGLEIHQQLNPEKGKLFCSCPSVLRNDEPDFIVERQLHVVAGEEGKVDVAAEYEAALGKKFIYQGYNDNVCLVELDEEPPHKINQEALKIALQIALLLNCKILPLSQIMRKTVIDGSNTSGFQRTVLIAKDGFVETDFGKVGIESVCLEEDAARIIERGKDKVIFRLDRLGIPLVEIATAPDIKNPEQAKEVALYLGNVLRTCKVKRGIGTIRQDVNMSIKKSGGVRVEIKGVQEPRLIAKTIKSEIIRQLDLIEKGKKIISEVRKANKDGSTEFLRPMPGAARMYPETDLPLLKIPKKLIDEAKKTLPKLKSEIEGELKQKGLNQEMINLILSKDKLEEFKQLLKIYKEKGNLIAKILCLYPKEIATKEKIALEKVETILEDNLILILNELKKGKILESHIKRIMQDIVKGKSFKEAIKFEKPEKLEEIEEKILKLIKEKPGLSEKAYMGLLMKDPTIRGRISGREIMEILQKFLK